MFFHYFGFESRLTKKISSNIWFLCQFQQKDVSSSSGHKILPWILNFNTGTRDPHNTGLEVWTAWFFKFLNSWFFILEKRTWNRSQKKVRGEPHVERGELWEEVWIWSWFSPLLATYSFDKTLNPEKNILMNPEPQNPKRNTHSSRLEVVWQHSYVRWPSKYEVIFCVKFFPESCGIFENFYSQIQWFFEEQIVEISPKINL